MKNFTNFSFHMYTDILFGRGVEAEAANMIRKHGGKRIMLVYGGGSIKKIGLYDRVIKTLKDGDLPVIELGGVQPNPRRSLVEKGLKIARDEKIDFLLAVGGGSSIDTAKAIALGLANGEYWQFYSAGVPVEKIAPMGTIHTISAAGSETSGSTVLVDDLDTGRKRGLMWAACRPVFALMNPELTYSVSAYQTGAGAVDILAHSVMRYFTAAASCLGDEYAEGTMRTVVKYAPIAIAKPRDYEARAELMLAGSFSHNDLTGIGRSGPRGGEHPLESQLSGHYDTAHGAGLAALMPAMLQYIADHGTPDQTARVAQFAVKVFGAEPDMADPRATAHEGLSRFRSWIRSLGMPLTLKELGIPREDLDAVVRRCVDNVGGTVPGYMEFDEKAVRAIFSSIVE
jgi:alcohol dehydrogenase YqhD (iron-dependent ADH family)